LCSIGVHQRSSAANIVLSLREIELITVGRNRRLKKIQLELKIMEPGT
jgi:hypothetical protein